MYEIGQRVEIEVNRQEENFDKACVMAYQRALGIFGCDEAGHLEHVKDSERSTDSIWIEFKKYLMSGSMGGQMHIYIFDIWVERSEE